MPTSLKTSPEFDTIYKDLNTAQRQAVDTIEGPVVVIAGPGTGKTTILTLRIANILRRTDTAPENILALTFTESGAYAMRRKLLEIIGPSAYKVAIHTFHGFAERVIQEYPDYFPRIIGSTIITDAEQIKMVETIIQSRKIDVLRPYGDPSYYVKPVLQEIHLLKRENVSPEALQESIEKEEAHDPEETSSTEMEKIRKRTEKNLEVAHVYKKYEEELVKQKHYDFDDMLLELIRAMESNPEFKLILQESFHYILADEHQDANASQNRILELIADFHASPNLFIVGDDKQAIYRFQGASLENFMYFSQKYPGTTVIELTHNYRSHQGILDASQSIILNNPFISGRAPAKLLSLQMGTKPIFVEEFPTSGGELDYLSVIVERLIKKGEKAEEIAILYRENKNAYDVSAALRSRGIVHRIESDHDILGDIDSVKVVALSRAIHDPSNDEHLAHALFLEEMGVDPAEVADLCALARKDKLKLNQVIKQSKATHAKKAYARIVQWSRDAAVLQYPDLLQKLIQETGMLTFITASPNSLERLNSLQALFDRVLKAAQSKKTFYLKDFIEYIDIVSTHGINTKRTYAEHVGGVRLMTAHRAKGLEFNHVFIIHAVDGTWGNRTVRTKFNIPVIEHARDTGRIEDERRLFYVAMTRARESVTITYALSNASKESIPSQFISEIEKSLITFEQPDVESEQSIFLKKLETPAITNPVSILEPIFVKSKFLSQPFSVTHLNNYLECAWKYFFVNLIRVPQALTKHQMYGTAVHAALRTFFEAYKEDRDLGKVKLVALFKHHLDMQPMSADDREDSFKKGKEALEGYYKTYEGTWPRNLLTEYAVRGVELVIINQDSRLKSRADGALRASPLHGNSKTEKDIVRIELTGKLDKIELMDARNVTVVDFKTAKPKSRNEIEGKTKAADGNYKRQLVFYKLLLEGNPSNGSSRAGAAIIASAAKKFVMKAGEIDFIEPNERKKYKKERFEITDKEVTDLKDVITLAVNDIINLNFVKGECKEKGCQYCGLGRILRGRK